MNSIALPLIIALALVMTMLNYLTSGESHGKCLTAVVQGLPYGIPVDTDWINRELQRRQGGYGRGARMKMEQDRAEIVSGVRHGKTLGSPVTLMIENRVSNSEELAAIEKPRPGHADLAGSMKFMTTDARGVSERASARETASRVAAGALANAILSSFGIHVCGYAVEIGGIASEVRLDDPAEIRRRRDQSMFYTLDESADARIKERVDEAKRDGDTLGGTVEVIAFDVPPGLGSHAGWDTKLDGNLAKALMSVQTIKGVEIGIGFGVSKLRGSEVHDGIALKEDGSVGRRRNHAGGIEGGISNGEPIVVRAASKPISTLLKPMETVHLATKEAVPAQIERSDVCVVPAASVIAEAVVAFEILRFFLDKFGGDTFEEVRQRFDAYRKKLQETFGKTRS